MSTQNFHIGVFLKGAFSGANEMKVHEVQLQIFIRSLEPQRKQVLKACSKLLTLKLIRQPLWQTLKRWILDLSVTTSIDMKNDHDENANSIFLFQ